MPLCTSRTSQHVLAVGGPRLDVEILLPEVVAKLRGGQQSFRGVGLIDTGASITCISGRAARALNLKPIATVRCGGATGDAETPLFMVSLAFPGAPIQIPDTKAIEATLEQQGLDVLIGRDVLAVSGFTYDGPAGSWTLELPREPAQPLLLPGPGASSSDRAKVNAKRKAAEASRKKNRRKK